ncbi:MAG TPA: hypothetical protein VKA68_10105 [bacterium]|nr:hypothetical protein [bacterium]
MKRISLLIVVILMSLLSVQSDAEPLVSYRAWQFHEMDVPYVQKTLQKAPEYNINTVVYSHGMIRQVSQLDENSGRGKQLRTLAQVAHDLDLKAWIWIHELEEDVPERYLDNDRVYLDRPGFWDWLENKYEQLFTDFPEFDGILLTFHETEYKIFSEEEVQSELSMPDRFARMINTIDDMCRKYNKDFVVRSFLYEPQQLEWFAAGLDQVHERVMLQSKCVPHDWQPYYPHNPMIGKFPERELIVEFDCSSEFTGKNRILYTSPEYFEYRWRYDLRQPGVVGYNARIDHGGYDAVSTPNNINLYTLYRLTEDPAVTARDIWDEWTMKHYGAKASDLIEKALKPSFEVVNRSFFAREFWITNHSELPSFDYANGHIQSRTIAKWKPDQPEYKQREQQLQHPDPGTLEWILSEKDTAIALAEESLEYLRQARPHLTADQYDDLYWRLALLHRTAIIWQLHAEAFFGYKTLAEGHHVPGLESRVFRAINALTRQAEVSRLNPLIGEDPPASAGELTEVTEELENLLRELR